jgi:hypothetical protein
VGLWKLRPEAAPGLTERLWDFAKSGYLDTPEQKKLGKTPNRSATSL